MPIENVFSIAGRGTVVTGKIEQGIVRAGDSIEILGLTADTTADVITQVESFGEVLGVRRKRATTSVVCFARPRTIKSKKVK